ncbi:sensor histidine kinase [Modestobacter sp. VKM Ac-2986]|uniref:sensor histidine kinase n=1 Tax=Modestobacter sp. VKM Ac-2986 TaxID=3004140 RepID=UPI0022AAC43B|nr:sensor histidine kinase [Modestobacter sp. VKM Ac-2986]MCZ2828759.1 sensor histidine kinase [Modestobacter sp. VKM Ac-2986]
MPATTTEPPLDGHVHELLVHDSPEELLAVAVPFLRAGLEAGESAVIATGDASGALLREALGDDERVVVIPRSEVYRIRTPTALTAVRRLVDQQLTAGSTRVRVLGETDFGRTPRDWLEWQRYEAVVNEAFRPLPLWGLCAYDTTVLPDELITTGLQTHPFVHTATGRQVNPDFVEPAGFLRSLPVPDEPLEGTAPLLRVDDVREFSGLRRAVARVLADLGGDPDLLEDLHLAIDEMSSNAVRHGGPPVTLRLWAGADRVVCRISDGGTGMDSPFAGYGPAHGEDLSRGGMGLWLARQLCDHVDVIDEGAGLTVRLTTSLH